MNSILDTVKKATGISLEDNGFDDEILLYTNTAIGILSQVGLIQVDKLPIIVPTSTWTDILNDKPELEIVKTYVTFKVRSMFDPPSSSAAADAMNKIIQELEWRISNIDLIHKVL